MANEIIEDEDKDIFFKALDELALEESLEEMVERLKRQRNKEQEEFGRSIPA